nr:hypothetical protein [Spirochaetota bacterium]
MKTRQTKGNATMQTIFRVLVLAVPVFVVLWLTASQLVGRSYSYVQTFNTIGDATSTGWANFGTAADAWPNGPYRMGRGGIFSANNPLYLANDQDTPSVITVAGGELQIFGRPNNCDITFNNIWMGKVARFLPQNSISFGSNIRASSFTPFGFMVTRTYAHVDSNNERATESTYHQSAINIWLARYEASKVNEWDQLTDAVYFFELTKRNWTASIDTSRLGYFDGKENFPATASGPTNQSYSGFSSSDWRIDYSAPGDTQYNTTTATTGLLNAYNYVLNGSVINPNTKKLMIRMLHDGSSVRYYLNPNSDGGLPGQPNEFYMIGKSDVSWNSDLMVMFGHESLFYMSEDQSAKYDDFVVRSVCDVLTASINPRRVLAGGSDIRYTIDITPTIQSSDSGIGEIIIAKPAFMTNKWQLATISVSNDYDDNGSLSSLSISTTTMPSAANQCYVRAFTNYDGRAEMLKIIFHSTPTSTGVIRSTTDNKIIRIGFNLKTPAVANSTGGEFEVYANLEKYNDFTWTYAQMVGDANGGLPTTGMKKAVPATEVGVTAPDTTMTVRSYGQPRAFASVTTSPAVINQGTTTESITAVTYEISTKGVVDRPAISQAVIELPTNAFLVTNASSLLINDDAGNISFSQTGGKRFITLNYAQDLVGSLPGMNGYDRITFTMYGTPILPEGVTNTNMVFPSTVNASAFVNGATAQYTETNTEFLKQTVSIAADNPKV